MPTYTGPRGTGFTSLADYLNLNRGAAQRMGDELVEDVNQRGAAAQGAIGDYGRKFLGQVAAGMQGYNAEGVRDEADALGRANAVTYTGPEDWDAATGKALGTQAADAAQRSKMATSQYGRGTLLQERYAPNGGYTAGAAGLDSFLAGRGAGNRASEAASKWSGLQDYLKGEQATGQTAVAAGKKAATDAATKYRDLAASLHQTSTTRPATAPMDPTKQAREDAATRARGEDVVSPDSQVTPGRKGGGGEEGPGNVVPVGYYEDETGVLRKKQKPTGGFVTSRR